ncbi:MAG: single-stranded DNA-binding protein [Hydrococcus sp. C42_A2020_068]|uniref:single-stranded DNA-binding protein n=1 Tax=Pleurocapsa sp. PCC 7327 TaxID=118163 RepID=UPI00029F9E08|nr:single-stranded DNA-binding protein [Pleurocapsa sp. PCC 7327]AFY78534.1 single stranded DNA-binding protein [Pleurocapsa sp. PCC 7327]MBF2021715.1 single-stranded DNA-binding protein [Hydrococcus sp. C42_A2020_068]
MSLNVVHLVGRAGRDPEVKCFESGSVLCTLTLAVNRPTSKNDEPDWFNLKIWGKTAEVAANYVRKGSLIGIQGTLTIETWTDDKTGTERSTPVIRVDRLDLLGSKRDADSSAVGGYGSGNSEF